MKKIFTAVVVILVLAVAASGYAVVHHFMNGAANILGDSRDAVVVEVETGSEFLVGQSLILSQNGDEEPLTYSITCEKTDGDRSVQTRLWSEKEIVLNLDAKSHYRIAVTPEASARRNPVRTWKAIASKNIAKCTTYRIASDAEQIEFAPDEE